VRVSANETAVAILVQLSFHISAIRELGLQRLTRSDPEPYLAALSNFPSRIIFPLHTDFYYRFTSLFLQSQTKILSVVKMATIDIHVIDIVHHDLDQLDHNQLIATANGLRNAYLDCLAEKDKQREEIRDLKGVLRASSFASSMSSFEMQPSWVRAELDSPGDTTFSCFGPRSKYRNVLVYDRNDSSLETRPRETLRGEPIYISCLSIAKNYRPARGHLFPNTITENKCCPCVCGMRNNGG
jgi:hypothetical protein